LTRVWLKNLDVVAPTVAASMSTEPQNESPEPRDGDLYRQGEHSSSSTGSSSSSVGLRRSTVPAPALHYLAAVCRLHVSRDLCASLNHWRRHAAYNRTEQAQITVEPAHTEAPRLSNPDQEGTSATNKSDVAVQTDDESTHGSFETDREPAARPALTQRLRSASPRSGADSSSLSSRRTQATRPSRMSRSSSSASWFSSVEIYSDPSAGQRTDGSTRSTCTPSYTGSQHSTSTASTMTSMTAEGMWLPRRVGATT